MDHSLTPDEQNRLIEDALATYPVLPVPRDLSAGVMAQIWAVPAPKPFRLAWSDLALGIVFALCIGAVLFSLNNLPPPAAAQIRKEGTLLYQHILVNARLLLPAFSFGLAGLLAALTIPYLRRESRQR